MLRNADLTLGMCDVVAVAHGPGSFTGIRIGISAAKGLAFAANKPMTGISTLEAMAMNCLGVDGLVVCAMDARRQQVYTAVFEYACGQMTRHTEDMAISTAELAERLKAFSDKSIYVVGDGYAVAHRELSSMGISLAETPVLLREENAYSVAKIALKLHSEGKTTSDLMHLPTYLRAPQAERERLEKLKSENK